MEDHLIPSTPSDAGITRLDRRSRLTGGVASTLVGVWALGVSALAMDVTTGSRVGSRTDAVAGLAGSLTELSLLSFVPAAAVVFSVGIATSMIIDHMLLGRRVRAIVISYASVGFGFGSLIGWIVPGPWETKVVFPVAGALAAIAGCVVTYRLMNRTTLVWLCVSAMFLPIGISYTVA